MVANFPFCDHVKFRLFKEESNPLPFDAAVLKETGMQAKELAKKIKSNTAPSVLDVRSGFEFRSGHIPGALHTPAWRILLRLSPLPKDKKTPLVVTCEHGPRAQLAVSLLKLAGYPDIELLDGHMAGWRRGGLPLEK